jgi:hypothetical protein
MQRCKSAYSTERKIAASIVLNYGRRPASSSHYLTTADDLWTKDEYTAKSGSPAVSGDAFAHMRLSWTVKEVSLRDLVVKKPPKP